MDESLRAGVAVYNAGSTTGTRTYFHAAHDAWEEYWLDLPAGTDDERLLHGLIQFTAAVYHAHEANWAGATGLAGSARDYLADLPSAYRDVNVGEVREWLGRLQSDPELLEREPPLPLRYGGDALVPSDLEFPAIGVVARILAGAFGYDEAVVETATTYAERDLAEGNPTSPFVSLVFDFVQEDDRDVVVRRLSEHVERRNQRRTDVEGLFEEDSTDGS